MKIDLSVGPIKIENATQRTICVLGQKGTGKTQTLKLIAYSLLSYDAGVYVFDLLNIIRIDGYRKIVVNKKDYDKGQMLATMMNSNKKMRVVIGFEGFLQGELTTFISDVFARWKPNNSIIIIDEIHEILPESVLGGEYSFEAERAIRHWRNAKDDSGNCGFVFSSQRPQFVSKKILSLCDGWLLYRVVGDRDRKPIENTLAGVIDDDKLRNMMAGLPQLSFLTGYWTDFYG